jgi:NAD(P)-dependent dehydrogenase (short-subunit alcohol dehydrogenase family)
VDLQGRVAILTGGRRMGVVVARELARRGADVVISYRRSADQADLAAGEVRSSGRRALTHAADLADAAACDGLIRAAAGTFGRVDVLVHMASTYEPRAFDTITEGEWDADLDANLKSAFLCAKAVVPEMRKVGGGRIINFADWVARSGRPRYRGFLGYYVAKAGVIALTEALALELAADGILVNAIAPGPILPPPDLSTEEMASVAEATPLGRWGGAEEIAKAVLALVDSDFMTGETIRVDGGRHVR